MKIYKQRTFFLTLPIFIGLLVAPTVLLFTKIVYKKSDLITAIQEIFYSQFKERENLFLVELLSLIPRVQ